jgi:pSer/pThr/pTyr-binding forkhead associated (FHA) protein
VFSVEIDFRDGISPPETVLLRRTSAILGGSERSHLIIDGAGSHVPEIQLYRGPGRTFFTASLNKSSQINKYSGEASLVFGNYKLHITSLDTDLCMGKEDLPDIAAVRVLRSAVSTPALDFPALCLAGDNLVYVSFYSKSDLIVGRSPYCSLRIDLPDVSSEHCRFGIENDSFWVEDLGSTNGTIVDGEKISGRHYLNPGQKVQIGTNSQIIPIIGSEELSELKQNNSSSKKVNITYPCLSTNSDLVRPNLKTLKQGVTLSIGRDPTCDVWINAPHISREHVKVTFEQDGGVKIIDCSSNGTFLNGKKLKAGQENKLFGPKVAELDLCSGIFINLLFEELANKQTGNPDVTAVELPKIKSDKDKLNEENYRQKAASDHVKEVEDLRLTDFEKYQLEQTSKVKLEEVFEDEEEFKILAARLEQERVLEAKAGEYRIVFFVFLLVLLIASICVTVFTSDYFF